MPRVRPRSPQPIVLEILITDGVTLLRWLLTFYAHMPNAGAEMTKTLRHAPLLSHIAPCLVRFYQQTPVGKRRRAVC